MSSGSQLFVKGRIKKGSENKNKSHNGKINSIDMSPIITENKWTAVCCQIISPTEKIAF